MPVEQLTYAQIAERLGVSSEAARAIVKRHRLPRSRSNDGKTLVAIELEEVRHKPLPARSPRGDQPVTNVVAILKAKIETLEAELVKTEERSAGHREDFERERARVDLLMSELLTATADLMAARTVTARLEGEIAALRSVAKPADHQPVTPRTTPSAGMAPVHSAPIERRRWWPWRRSAG
jgi:hypothetical protein